MMFQSSKLASQKVKKFYKLASVDRLKSENGIEPYVVLLDKRHLRTQDKHVLTLPN